MWYEWDDNKEELENVLKALVDFKHAASYLPTLYSVPVGSDGDLEFRMDILDVTLSNLRTALESHIKLIDKLNNGEMEYDEDGDLIY